MDLLVSTKDMNKQYTKHSNPTILRKKTLKFPLQIITFLIFLAYFLLVLVFVLFSNFIISLNISFINND